MPRRPFRALLNTAIAVFATVGTLSPAIAQAAGTPAPALGKLLSDPFLQAPGVGTVNVVWFSATPGNTHAVLTGEAEALNAIDAASAGRAAAGEVEGIKSFAADTFQLSRMFEDADSFIDNPPAAGIVERDVYRHEATVTGLPPQGRTPYRVVSINEDGSVALSGVFSARDAIEPGEDALMLLTSDHQQKNNAPANLQWAKEVLGEIDITLIAGDLVNVPDRASEWFDHNKGLAFFPGLQGNAHYTAKNGRTYSGGQIAQNSVIYSAIGNHEVQGRIDGVDSLDESFTSPVPREVAEAEYEKVAASVNPQNDPAVRETWIENNSFSTRSYEEIFTLPESASGKEKYYATTVGNTRVITLFSTRIWRGLEADPNPADREKTSRYQEAAEDLGKPLEMGHGSFIFEDLAVGSDQYEWLAAELDSPETNAAEHVIVMLHESPHSLGDNVMPHFADPITIEEHDDAGNLIGIRYEYPAANNVLMNSLMPLIDHPDTPVDLVFNGHNHLWNRFKSDNGVNFIETSNVGNSYGAYLPLSADGARPTPPEPWFQDDNDYMAYGSPGGLEAVIPTEKTFRTANDLEQWAPYVASNRYSIFSSFDTATGEVSSYIFDSENPDEPPVLMDVFSLKD